MSHKHYAIAIRVSLIWHIKLTRDATAYWLWSMILDSADLNFLQVFYMLMDIHTQCYIVNVKFICQERNYYSVTKHRFQTQLVVLSIVYGR